MIFSSLGSSRVVVGTALAVQLLARPAYAQAVAGVGDDAIPIPSGRLRIGLGGLWNDYRDAWSPVSGGSGLKKGPLLGALNTDALGTTVLPGLAAAESAMRVLAGQSAFQLSMGPLEARGEVRQSIAPITLDYGISRRLSVKLVVPYVESRDATQFILNRGGIGANVGANPAYGSTGASARAVNGALVTQLANARAQLLAEIARCADAMALNCDAVRADPTGAQSLVMRTAELRAAVITVYGDATRGGSPVVPISGSALQTAVTSTLNDLRTSFTAFGIEALASTSPSAAASIFGQAGVAAIASDSAFGIGYDRLGATRRAGIGDVDLAATWLLWDTFKADQVQRLLAPRRGVRSTMTAGWRFGTAGADRTDDAFDVPIGDGANALLLRSTTDLLLSARTWVSATVRVVHPLSDEVAMSLPPRSIAGTFDGPLTVARATRSLGQRIDLELAPRISIGQFFGLSAALLHRRWAGDQFDYVSTDSESGTSTKLASIQTPSRTFNAASFGLTFSSLASYARGRSRFPAEVMYTHLTPLSASGGFVPAMSSDRLELRVYTGFPRR